MFRSLFFWYCGVFLVFIVGFNIILLFDLFGWCYLVCLLSFIVLVGVFVCVW